VKLSALVGKVRDRMGNGNNVPVFINGDRRSDLGMVVKILDLLKNAGIREVSIECAEEVP
jgi:biopolymer transport protein ExbD